VVLSEVVWRDLDSCFESSGASDGMKLYAEAGLDAKERCAAGESLVELLAALGEMVNLTRVRDEAVDVNRATSFSAVGRYTEPVPVPVVLRPLELPPVNPDSERTDDEAWFSETLKVHATSFAVDG